MFDCGVKCVNVLSWGVLQGGLHVPLVGSHQPSEDEMAYCGSITALERGGQWQAAVEQLKEMSLN